MFPILLFSQLRDSVFFRVEYNNNFNKITIIEGCYSEKLEQPLWVQYVVLCKDGEASRKGLDFFTNDSIHTSNSADYYKNVYDKGHLAPAADFNCTRDMVKETFTYLNCSLQHEDLNRKTWKYLESYERELAQTGVVCVKVILDFDSTCKKLPTGATVPKGFYKIIETKDNQIKYYFPNIKPTSSNYNDYLIQQ